MSERIAGKRFRELTPDELNALIPKLESIIRKGGIKAIQEKPQPREIAKLYSAIRQNTALS